MPCRTPRWLSLPSNAARGADLWLAGHYPIYDPKSVDPRKRAAFVPLMRKYNASGYLAGHCHTMQHFDTASRVAGRGAGGEGFAFVVSGCGKECNNPAQPLNASAAWNAGCGDDPSCGVVQSYRYSPNTTGVPWVNSSFVSMLVQAGGLGSERSGIGKQRHVQYVMTSWLTYGPFGVLHLIPNSVTTVLEYPDIPGVPTLLWGFLNTVMAYTEVSLISYPRKRFLTQHSLGPRRRGRRSLTCRTRGR